ncbi:unnamed protein product [Mytilus coruscus]|uniref:Uncharacterized protein n=1 Tax=Mytilus coruscus TaxID=42192 RepID=A0A6J8DK77_MYTCO|nr:unnamed protein product [Mytilus coruscus]
MYCVAASTPTGDSKEMVSKWLSVAHQVQNKHRGHSDQTVCTGNKLAKTGKRNGIKACVKMEDLLTATRLQTSVKKLSPLHQTSDVEAFHSTINHFATKMTASCENSGRPQVVTKDGLIRYSIHFPKYKSDGYITKISISHFPLILYYLSGYANKGRNVDNIVNKDISAKNVYTTFNDCNKQ